MFEMINNFSTSYAMFPYACEKSENGRTRIYMLLSDDSNLLGGHLYIVDHNGEVNEIFCDFSKLF